MRWVQGFLAAKSFESEKSLIEVHISIEFSIICDSIWQCLICLHRLNLLSPPWSIWTQIFHVAVKGSYLLGSKPELETHKLWRIFCAVTNLITLPTSVSSDTHLPLLSFYRVSNPCLEKLWNQVEQQNKPIHYDRADKLWLDVTSWVILLSKQARHISSRFWVRSC